MTLRTLRLDLVIDGERRTLLTVVDGDEAVAVVYVWHEGERAAQFSKLFVRRDYRRRKIASSLIAQAEEMAIASGCDTMTAIVKKENEDAQDLYRKCGYFFAFNYEDGDLLMCKQLSGMT